MSLPFTFTATTPVLIPPEAFPTPELQARARKLPMWDNDREMLIMKVQSQREYLVRLRRTTQSAMDDQSTVVQGVHERVRVETLHKRWLRQTQELAWEEQLLTRNDLLLAERA